jgi:uncharacterized protein YneF (UPF0154 family)
VGGLLYPQTRPEAKRTPEEEKIIRMLETDMGRKLSQKEINLILDQARHFGEL